MLQHAQHAIQYLYLYLYLYLMNILRTEDLIRGGLVANALCCNARGHGFAAQSKDDISAMRSIFSNHW